MPERNQVFISYSHQDKAALERLKVHLKPLMQENRLDVWDDTQIKAGDSITGARKSPTLWPLPALPSCLSAPTSSLRTLLMRTNCLHC